MDGSASASPRRSMCDQDESRSLTPSPMPLRHIQIVALETHLTMQSFASLSPYSSQMRGVPDSGYHAPLTALEKHGARAHFGGSGAAANAMTSL